MSLGSDRFLAYTRVDGDSGLLILDAQARLAAAAPFTFPGDASVPRDVRRDAVNGSGACTRRDGEGFAIHYPGAGRIQLYDRDGRLRELADVPYPSDEIFRQDPKSRLLIHSADREYYKDCKYSDRLLFALFKGRRIAENIPKDPVSGSRFVHVFDLDGRLLKVLRLDRPVTTIEPDRSGHVLYAAARDAAEVYRFRLPRLIP